MFGSRWVTTSWLSGSLRSFLYSSSMYCCYFLIFCASLRSLLSLSFIVPILAWNIPLISLIFLNRSLVFPILMFNYISLHCSLKKIFLSLLALLWISAFSWACFSLPLLLFASLLSSAIYKASSNNHFALLNFFFFGMILVTTSCIMLRTSVHYSSVTLSMRSNHMNLFVTSTE